MREYPWHQRKALLKHHRWFRNLVDFHAITRAWLEESGHPDHVNLSSDFAQDLSVLEQMPASAMPDARLETLLDDTATEDLLGRLEHAVWAAQAWTYSTLSSRIATSGGAQTLQSALEQATWRLGQSVAGKRWGEASPGQMDLRSIFLTLVDSPIALSLGEDAFLMKRGLASDLEFELRACPHVLRFPETIPAADQLCSLHSAWIRGYLYGFNPKIRIEYFPRKPGKAGKTENRCRQHWTL